MAPTYITVEEVHLYEKILDKFLITDDSEKREQIGEILFYFLEIFIPQYNINKTNGLYDNFHLCAKITGILLEAKPTQLLQIVSSTQALYSTLIDLVEKLAQN